MEREVLKKHLLNYQKRLREYLRKGSIEQKRCHSENNTTIKFIVPLLQILGWDPLSKDMEFEYTVRGRKLKRPHRVDIALYTQGPRKPKILVEIKRIQDDLGTGRQVLRYLHARRIKYAIYTNGKEIRLLDNRTPTKYRPEGLFIIKIEDFIKYKDVLTVLTKGSVESGKLDRLAKSYHAPEFWGSVIKGERKIKRSERKDMKYVLRLEYARKQI